MMWANYKGQNNLVILIISLCDNQAKMSSTFRKPNPVYVSFKVIKPIDRFPERYRIRLPIDPT